MRIMEMDEYADRVRRSSRLMQSMRARRRSDGTEDVPLPSAAQEPSDEIGDLEMEKLAWTWVMMGSDIGVERKQGPKPSPRRAALLRHRLRQRRFGVPIPALELETTADSTSKERSRTLSESSSMYSGGGENNTNGSDVADNGSESGEYQVVDDVPSSRHFSRCTETLAIDEDTASNVANQFQSDNSGLAEESRANVSDRDVAVLASMIVENARENGVDINELAKLVGEPSVSASEEEYNYSSQEESESENEHNDNKVEFTPIELEALRKDLKQYYRRYAPEKVAKVDAILDQFHGKEDELLKICEQKYGVRVPDPRGQAMSGDELVRFRGYLLDYYQVHCPEKVAKVDPILHHFRGRERRLMDVCLAKYGAPLRDPSSPPSVIAEEDQDES